MSKKINISNLFLKIFTFVFLSVTFGYAICDDSKVESQEVIINVCRQSSIIRAGERPDVLVNETLVGDIPRGSNKKFTAKVGDKYSFKTHASMLMFRFKDETLFQNVVEAPEEIYLIVKAQVASAGAVVSQLFGGAIAESIRQNSDDAPSGNWIIEKVTQSEFEKFCSDIK